MTGQALHIDLFRETPCPVCRERRPPSACAAAGCPRARLSADALSRLGAAMWGVGVSAVVATGVAAFGVPAVRAAFRAAVAEQEARLALRAVCRDEAHYLDRLAEARRRHQAASAAAQSSGGRVPTQAEALRAVRLEVVVGGVS